MTTFAETHGVSIAESFAQYDREHPQIYTKFVKLATQMAERGYRRYSPNALMEVLRYQSDLIKGPNDAYKINDAYTSRYARKFMEEFPQYQNFFETRRLRN